MSIFVSYDVVPKYVADQLKFLLAAAPMIDAPIDRERAAASATKFAYIHPKSFAKIPGGRIVNCIGVFAGSPTRWVLMSTMPEGRVIYSSEPIPHMEKILNS